MNEIAATIETMSEVIVKLRAEKNALIQENAKLRGEMTAKKTARAGDGAEGKAA